MTLEHIMENTFQAQKSSSLVQAMLKSSFGLGSLHQKHQCEQNRVSAAVQLDSHGCEK